MLFLNRQIISIRAPTERCDVGYSLTHRTISLIADLIAIGRRVVMGFRSAHLREVWLITFFFRCIFYFDPRRQHSAECGDLKLSREAYHTFAYVITSNVINF